MKSEREELLARIAELERLVMVMAEKIWLMSTNLTLVSIKKEKRNHVQQA